MRQTPLSVTLVEQGGAPLEDVFLGPFQVLDPQIKWNCWGRAGSGHRGGRWSPPLEGQHEPVVWRVAQPSLSDHRGSGWFTTPPRSDW